MNTKRKKHLKNLIAKSNRAKKTLRHVREVYTLTYNNVYVKYLPSVDDFVMYIDMTVNGQNIRTMGVITPEALVDEGIHTITPEKAIDRSMTCNELYLTRHDVPNLFNIVKAFYYTIGDLWDSGEELTASNSPQLMISNDGKTFSDMDIPNLSRIIENLGVTK